MSKFFNTEQWIKWKTNFFSIKANPNINNIYSGTININNGIDFLKFIVITITRIIL